MESRDQRPLLREKAGLVLFLGLRPMREHAITTRECVAYHLLKRGALYTFHELRFSYKRKFMENPNKTMTFFLLPSRRVFLRDRESVLHEQLLFMRSGSDQDLFSTVTYSETVALEVISSTLRVDTVKGEPMTWFSSAFAALAIGSVL